MIRLLCRLCYYYCASIVLYCSHACLVVERVRTANAGQVEAEAFRIWALQLVRLQMDKQVSAVRDMYKKLVDATTLDGPFSATAIFAAVGFSSLIVQNLAPSNGLAAGPGPAQLLQVSNGVENREQKEKQQQGLERILQEFQRSGFSEFS